MAEKTLDEVIAIKNAHEAELLAKPNVHGVGVGSRRVGGVITDDFAIFVYVTKKSDQPGPDRIPDTIDGVSVEVVEEPRMELHVEAFRATEAETKEQVLNFEPTDEQRPVFGGISIGPCRFVDGNKVTAGTLGLIVRGQGRDLALSNFHVLYSDDGQGKQGDSVTQPGTLDFGSCRGAFSTQIGTIVNGVLQGAPAADGVDAATSTIDTTSAAKYIVNIGWADGSAAPKLNSTVRKAGRTSGLMQGTVTNIAYTLSLDYGAYGKREMRNQIRVEPAISQSGDSGSALVDENNRVVGLIIGGNQAGSTANRFDAVAGALNIAVADPNLQSTAMGTDSGGNLQVVSIDGLGWPALIYQGRNDDRWHWMRQDANFDERPSINDGSYQKIALGGAQAPANNTLFAICKQSILGRQVDVPVIQYQDRAIQDAWFQCAIAGLPANPAVGTQMAVGRGANNRLSMFLSDANHQLSEIRQDAGAGLTFTWSLVLPNPPVARFTKLVTGNDPDGKLQVIGLFNKSPYLFWQDMGGTWHSYGQLCPNETAGMSFSDIALCAGNNRQLQLILIRDTGRPYLIWQDREKTAWHWSGEFGQVPVDRIFGTLAMQSNADGLFAILLSANPEEVGRPYLLQQNTNGSWVWRPDAWPDRAGARFSSLAASFDVHGRLQVMLIGRLDGAAYLLWRNNNNANWYWSGKFPFPPP